MDDYLYESTLNRGQPYTVVMVAKNEVPGSTQTIALDRHPSGGNAAVYTTRSKFWSAYNTAPVTSSSSSTVARLVVVVVNGGSSSVRVGGVASTGNLGSGGLVPGYSLGRNNVQPYSTATMERLDQRGHRLHDGAVGDTPSQPGGRYDGKARPVRLLVVLPATVQAWGNRAAWYGDGKDDGALETFTVGLSVIENGPMTHYWCSWGGLSEEQYTDLQRRFTTLQAQDYGVRVWDGDTVTPDDVLAETGLHRPTADP